jgi:hypothetical protein
VISSLDFVVNLRNMTASREFRAKLRPPGYLVPPAYLTEDLREKAVAFSRRGAIIVADNGLFDDIVRLAARLEGSRNSGQLARRAATLAETVDPQQHLTDQISVEPSALIGVEDITAALWLRLALTARELPNQRAALRRRNTQTARRATELADSVPEGCEYLAVASAQDHDTAYDAGRAFAAAGLKTAALGFGAFMNDDSTTREVKIGGRYRRLRTPMPNRYLGTALVARGFWDGWQREHGGAPRRFHFLGLGAPIMIGIVSCAAAATPALTFDATSPIKDAKEATLYVSRPAYLKIRTWKAAARLASSEDERWACPCPFCRAFTEKHPFDYHAGRAWLQRRRDDVVPAAALRPRGGLYHAYPLLGQPNASNLGREIDFARVGHNHWALKQVTVELARARHTHQLINHVEKIVAAYEQATPLHNYAAAVQLAFDIARGAWP